MATLRTTVSTALTTVNQTFDTFGSVIDTLNLFAKHYSNRYKQGLVISEEEYKLELIQRMGELKVQKHKLGESIINLKLNPKHLEMYQILEQEYNSLISP